MKIVFIHLSLIFSAPEILTVVAASNPRKSAAQIENKHQARNGVFLLKSGKITDFSSLFEDLYCTVLAWTTLIEKPMIMNLQKIIRSTWTKLDLQNLRRAHVPPPINYWSGNANRNGKEGKKNHLSLFFPTDDIFPCWWIHICYLRTRENLSHCFEGDWRFTM